MVWNWIIILLLFRIREEEEAKEGEEGKKKKKRNLKKRDHTEAATPAEAIEKIIQVCILFNYSSYINMSRKGDVRQ